MVGYPQKSRVEVDYLFLSRLHFSAEEERDRSLSDLRHSLSFKNLVSINLPSTHPAPHPLQHHIHTTLVSGEAGGEEGESMGGKEGGKEEGGERGEKNGRTTSLLLPSLGREGIVV